MLSECELSILCYLFVGGRPRQIFDLYPEVGGPTTLTEKVELWGITLNNLARKGFVRSYSGQIVLTEKGKTFCEEQLRSSKSFFKLFLEFKTKQRS